jgi:hypothetical protein
MSWGEVAKSGTLYMYRIAGSLVGYVLYVLDNSCLSVLLMGLKPSGVGRDGDRRSAGNSETSTKRQQHETKRPSKQGRLRSVLCQLLCNQ